MAAAAPVWTRHFNHAGALVGEEAGKTSTEASGAVDAGAADGSALARPGEQLFEAARRRGEASCREQPAELVDERSDVLALVRVDSEDDLVGVVWHGGHRASFRSR
jgi:hypothetical protein